MARQDLGKIVSEVTSVNVTVDNNVGVPSAEASISGTLTEKELSINFKNLKGEKGDKPTKGTDYYTDQEKQEFITETNALVVAEGKKQVKELQNQGSLSIERLLKIQKEIEAILQNQEAIGNALALNGKSGPQYDKEIRSIAGGEFDSDLLFLNDAGTKTAGKLYYDKNKSGVFKCIQTTTSTVNSTTNFVDVSSLENANKLENLRIIWKEITQIKEPIPDEKGYFTLTQPFSYVNDITGKTYDFYYVFVSVSDTSIGNDLFPIIVDYRRFIHLGSIPFLYLENKILKLSRFSQLRNSVTKTLSVNSNSLNFKKIIFYGGYISN